MMKVLAWMAGVVLLILGVTVAYLQYGDLQPYAEWAAAELLQRELHVAGRFDLDLLPAPRILVEDVSLANASGGSEPRMLQAGHLSARVAAWSLISGPIRVHDVRARDVDVLVETSAGGDSNWTLVDSDDPLSAEPEAPTFILESLSRLELPVVVERAEVHDVAVTVRARNEPDRLFAIHALNVTPDPTGGKDIDLDGLVTGVPLKLEGQVARAADRGLDLAFHGTLGQLSLAVGGVLGATSKVTARVSADDLAALLDRLDVSLPLPGLEVSGRLEVDGRLEGGRDGFVVDADAVAGLVRAHGQATVKEGSATFATTVASLAELGHAFDVAGLPDAELQVGGRLLAAGEAVELQDGTAAIGDARARFDVQFDAGEVRGTIDASGPRLADLGFDLPDLPFRVALTAARHGETVELDGIQLELADSDLAGSITLSSREPLTLTARLKSDRLYLTRLLPEPTGQTHSEPAAESDSGFVFESTPLPFDRLNDADLDLELRVGSLVRGNLQLTDLNVTTRLADGDLQGKVGFRGPEGGNVRGNLTLRASEQPAKVKVRGGATDLRINLMSGEVADPLQIPPMGISLDLEFEGASPRALAASASGRVLFTQGPGRIDSRAAVPWLSGDLLTQLLQTLNPFARKASYSDLECSVFLMELEDGMGQVPVLLMQDSRIRVVGKGTIDLDTERLQVEFNTQPRKGIGVGADMFVTPFVMLSGTLMNPAVQMNKQGVLLRGGAAFLTGGASVIGRALMDRASGQRDHCAAALEAAGAPGTGRR